MLHTKLSDYELALISDSKVLLTKNLILKKVIEMLSEVSNYYVSQSLISLPARYVQTAPKISKGENYKGLPYIILDYPRQFEKEDMFAIRSFFWWGNYFSIFLLISGKYKTQLSFEIQTALKSGKLNDWYLQVSDDKWDHHIENSNYRLVKELSEVSFDELSFIKLAKKIPLQEWDNAQYFFEENFTSLIKLFSLK